MGICFLMSYVWMHNYMKCDMKPIQIDTEINLMPQLYTDMKEQHDGVKYNYILQILVCFRLPKKTRDNINLLNNFHPKHN